MASTHIIIVNYNAGSWLTRAARSALDFSDGAVTIVDNCSQDSSVADTQAQLTSSRLKWQLNRHNCGFAAANNQVLKNVDSDYAVLMNPDCVLNAHSLALILAQMAQDPSIGLASGRILNEDGSLQASCRRRFPTPWSAFVRLTLLSRLLPNNRRFADFDEGDSITENSATEAVEAISGAFMVARMRAVAQVGLLDEGYFMHCEDLDWCKRFALQQWKVALVPTASVVHAKSVSSKSHPIAVLYTLHKGMNRFFDKFYRQQYRLPLRLLVKLGIVVSFVFRASGAVLATLRR